MKIFLSFVTVIVFSISVMVAMIGASYMIANPSVTQEIASLLIMLVSSVLFVGALISGAVLASGA